MSQFNRQAFSRLGRLAWPFFVSEMKFKVWGLLLLIVGFGLSVKGMDYVMSYIGRDFMTALSLKEKDEFIRQLYLYLGAFAATTPLIVFYRYTEERVGLLWRQWMTRRMISQYFQGRAYYRVSSYEGIDNPDQRIAEDIRTFCSTSLSFMLIIFNSCVALFLFTKLLWSISFNLVIAVVLYAAFGSALTYLLGRPLIGLNFLQLKKEADFRYKLINIRDHAESIALLGGERKESTRARQRLKEAVKNLVSIINWNRNLNFFTTGYNYIITILPTIIVAPLYLKGEIEFGVITQAAGAFIQVLNALSIIVTNFGSLSTFAAVITRLGSFAEAVEMADNEKPPAGERIIRKPGDHIEFQHLTVMTPKGDKTLTKDLSIRLDGKRLLITGTSGAGKSSLFRVLAGLWERGQGTVISPPSDQIFFIPQRPYMVLGSLRSQLVYAMPHQGVADAELFEVIKKVGLESMFHRVGGFNAIMDWPQILSTGEQQMLTFARLLLVKPKFVCVDEATTALDTAAEVRIYELLNSLGVNYISIGYRATLAGFHDMVLELHSDGTWTVENLKKDERK